MALLKDAVDRNRIKRERVEESAIQVTIQSGLRSRDEQPFCSVAYRLCSAIGLDTLVVEPVVNRSAFGLNKEDLCRAPLLTRKVCSVGSLACFPVERKDYESISPLAVTVKIRA